MNLPQAIRRAVMSSGASAQTRHGHLPPSSSVTGVRCRAAAAITARPTRGAAGEEDGVEPLAQQRLGGLALALHDGDVFLRKGRADELGNRGGGVRRELGRFEHDAVARGQRADQRREQKLERIVPRADDEGHAIGLGSDEPARGPGEQRGAAALGLHPRRQVAEGMADFAQHEADFGGVGLMRRFAQVGVERGEQGGLVRYERVVELAELRAAETPATGWRRSGRRRADAG